MVSLDASLIAKISVVMINDDFDMGPPKSLTDGVYNVSSARLHFGELPINSVKIKLDKSKFINMSIELKSSFVIKFSRRGSTFNRVWSKFNAVRLNVLSINISEHNMAILKCNHFN